MTLFDLRAARLRSGEEYRDEQQVEIAPLVFGGLRYVAVPEQVPAELAITRATTGSVFELRLHVRLHGPCFRCLDYAVVERDLPLRAYQATRPEGSDELTAPYLAASRLDLSSWARD